MKRLGQSKETVAYLVGLYHAILDDCLVYYPEIEKCVTLDKEHISSLATSRGLPLFLVDLPALDSLLLDGLECGVYITSGEPLTRSSRRRGMIPRLFEGLYLHVFSSDGLLLANADPCAIGFLHQLFQLAKKFKHTCQQEKVDETIKKFHVCDVSLPEPTWNGWSQSDASDSFGTLSCLDIFDDERLCFQVEHDGRHRNKEDLGYNRELIAFTQKVFDIVACDLGEFSPQDWSFKHGPGAVSDRTADRYKYRFANWSDQLEAFFPSSDFAFANYMDWADRFHEIDASKDIVASKLVAVPKTYKGPRLIACEPTAHQWCQQSIRDFLHSTVKGGILGDFISFENQALSGSGALLASYTRDAVTADLSDASDRVSCYVIERIFRRNPSLLNALASCRTRYVKQDLLDAVPSVIKLRKFSTMGSAVTFPIESIVFCMIGLAAVLFSEGCRKPNLRLLRACKDKLRIFGDDIIVTSKAWDNMNRVLTLLLFKVNERKTFSRGNFRESCGVDAFRGIDITPTRVNTTFESDSPESVLSSIELSNHLHVNGLWKAAQYIKETIDPNNIFVIRRIGSGSVGFDSFVGASICDNEWDDQTNQFMAKTLTFKTKVDINATDGMSCFVQWQTEKPSLEGGWSSGSTMPRQLKMRRGRVPVSNYM